MIWVLTLPCALRVHLLILQLTFFFLPLRPLVVSRLQLLPRLVVPWLQLLQRLVVFRLQLLRRLVDSLLQLLRRFIDSLLLSSIASSSSSLMTLMTVVADFEAAKLAAAIPLASIVRLNPMGRIVAARIDCPYSTSPSECQSLAAYPLLPLPSACCDSHRRLRSVSSVFFCSSQ